MLNLKQTKKVSMMRRLAGLLVVAFALSGCGKKDSSTSIDTRGNGQGRSNPQVQSQVSGNIQLNGVAFTEEAYQDDFNEMVRDFLEASIARDYVGHVSCRASNNTGLFLGGQVTLESGLLRASMPKTNISVNSQLLVAVYDYFPNSTPGPIPPVYLKNAIGVVQGNYAYIKFYDDYGSVELEGNFDMTNFKGEMRFDNQRQYDGSSPGKAGTIGSFQIPTCQFFRCG